MKVTPTALPGVLLIETQVVVDDRGFFMESWNARDFREATGVSVEFVQDSHSCSWSNVLRGIHFQVVKPQGKLVRVVSGAVFDVAVDLRRSSPTFGRWVGNELSADNRHQVWIPEGFGHAFLALTPQADVLYKATAYWIEEYSRTLAWNDPDVGIDWPITQPLILAPKDLDAPLLAQAETYP